jgi:ribosome-binding protein aMBF1 (putative translation factor)
MGEYARVDYENVWAQDIPGMPWEETEKELMKNPEFAALSERTQPYYELIEQVIGERIAQDMTQGELAEKAGTKQGNISRFESMNTNPSLEFMQKVAAALGRKLEIRLV